MRIRQPIDIENVHFLDHSLWRCRGLPGGRPAHIRYAWQIQWRMTVMRHTICRIRHRPVVGWMGRQESLRPIQICGRCLAPIER